MKQVKIVSQRLCIFLLILLSISGIVGEKVCLAVENTEGSLTIQLNDIGTPRKNVEFVVYKIADLDIENSRWILDEKVSILKKNLDLNQEKTASIWKKEALELTEIVRKTNISSVLGVTDENGCMTLQGLEKGMYLIVQNDEAEYGTVLPFLVSIPKQINGEWKYEVIASPKGEIIGPEEEIPSEPVDTGDDVSYGGYFLMLIGSVSILSLILAFKKTKNVNRFLAFLMTFIIASSVSMSVSAEGSDTKTIPEWATNVVIESAPDDQYVYQFSDSCPLYQRGQYRFGCGYYNWRRVQLSYWLTEASIMKPLELHGLQIVWNTLQAFLIMSWCIVRISKRILYQISFIKK